MEKVEVIELELYRCLHVLQHNTNNSCDARLNPKVTSSPGIYACGQIRDYGNTNKSLLENWLCWTETDVARANQLVCGYFGNDKNA